MAEQSSVMWAGSAEALATIGAAIFAIPLARLAERRGRRSALSFGMLVGAAGVGAILLAQLVGATILYTQLWMNLLSLIGFVLLGAGAAVGLQSRFAIIDFGPSEFRGRDLSLVMWTTAIGVVAGFVLLLRLDNDFGVCVSVLVVQLFAAIVISVGMPEITITERQQTRRKQYIRVPPRAGASISSLAVIHMAVAPLMSIVWIRLGNVEILSDFPIIVFSFYSVSMYILAPLFGIVSDRIGRIPVLKLGYGLVLASIVLLVIAADSYQIIVVCLILLGLGWSAAIVASSVLVVDSAPMEDRIAVQGRSDMIMNIASICGAVVAGLIGTFTGTFVGVAVPASGMAVLLVLTLVLVLPVLNRNY